MALKRISGKGKSWLPLARATVKTPLGLETYELGEAFMNNIYTVFRRKLADGCVHLSIKRNDKQPCNDWRHFQRIKNELCGAEWEAVQLYPAESRLVDTSNQYHLWCFPDKLPIGWDEGRMVDDKVRLPGQVQRPGADWPQGKDTVCDE